LKKKFRPRIQVFIPDPTVCSCGTESIPHEHTTKLILNKTRVCFLWWSRLLTLPPPPRNTCFVRLLSFTRVVWLRANWKYNTTTTVSNKKKIGFTIIFLRTKTRKLTDFPSRRLEHRFSSCEPNRRYRDRVKLQHVDRYTDRVRFVIRARVLLFSRSRWNQRRCWREVKTGGHETWCTIAFHDFARVVTNERDSGAYPKGWFSGPASPSPIETSTYSTV
jgi:hypothetical protein